MTVSDEEIEIIEKYALQNAVKYGKPPQMGAVMGKVMGECPHLRKNAKQVSSQIKLVIDEITNGDPEGWRSRLEELAPELIDELSVKKEPTKGLKDLDVSETEKVVMRFAPNPNGPPTLGSTRGIVVNSEYVKRYGGKFIIRFDDTDPQTKRPILEAYDWYIQDCEWLDAKPDRVVLASDNIETYYKYAEQLIEMDKAYVCFCEGSEFKQYKDSKEPCPHRDISPESNLDNWEKMIDGEYDEKEAVLRIKTDIQHPDPALRDFGAFRIVKTPHPRPEISDRYVVWPLLDFEGAIEDHELGMTHIIRGKDLMDSEKRQKYIYDYLGWEYPKTTHWGRIKIHELGSFSTSQIRKDIEDGVYEDWADPKLPTLRAFRRRGIQPEAIRKFMIDMGVGETDISVSLDSLYAENRKVIDPIANRYFYVWDPVEMSIEDGPDDIIVNPALHPFEKRGTRDIQVGSSIYICSDDLDLIKIGDKVRLKDLYNVEIMSIEPLVGRYIGDSVDDIKKQKMRIIHWCPLNGVDVTVRSPDKEFKGICEPGILNELGKVVQFERFAFCRVDTIEPEIIAYYTHK